MRLAPDDHETAVGEIGGDAVLGIVELGGETREGRRRDHMFCVRDRTHGETVGSVCTRDVGADEKQRKGCDQDGRASKYRARQPATHGQHAQRITRL